MLAAGTAPDGVGNYGVGIEGFAAVGAKVANGDIFLSWTEDCRVGGDTEVAEESGFGEQFKRCETAVVLH